MDCFPEETITSMPCYLLLFHFSIQNYTHLFAIHSMFVLSHLFPVSHIECEFAPERGVPEIGLFPSLIELHFVHHLHMEEEYDTNAFVIFVIAMISMYILFASIFIYKRIRRLFSKEPVVGISIVNNEIDSSEEERTCRDRRTCGRESTDSCLLD